MAWVKRTFACHWCGVTVTRKVANGKIWQCRECGLERMVSSALQMSRREGPAWEAWKASPGPSGRPRNVNREG